MKNYIVLMQALTLLLVGVSCESIAPTADALSADEVALRMSTRSTGGNSEIRLVSIGTKDQVDAGMVHRDMSYTAVNNGYPIKLPTRIQDVYVMEHTPPADCLSTAQQAMWKHPIATTLPKLVYPYIQGLDETAVLQLADSAGFEVTSKTKSLKLEMEYAMVKVVVNLNVLKSDYPDPEKYVVIDTLRIRHLPRYSHLYPRGNAEGRFYTPNVANYKPWSSAAYMSSESAVVVAEATADTGFDFTYKYTFYVPEYIFLDNKESAMLELYGHTNGSNPQRGSYWETPLGKFSVDHLYEPTKKLEESTNSLIRNQQYYIDGQVKGYGKQDIWIELDVKTWNWIQLDHELE